MYTYYDGILYTHRFSYVCVCVDSCLEADWYYSTIAELNCLYPITVECSANTPKSNSVARNVIRPA